MGNWIKILIMAFSFILPYAVISAQIYENTTQIAPIITSESPFDWNGEHCIKDESKWGDIEVGPDSDQSWVVGIIVKAEGDYNDQEPAEFFRAQSNRVMIGMNTLSEKILDKPFQGLSYAFTAYLKKQSESEKTTRLKFVIGRESDFNWWLGVPDATIKSDSGFCVKNSEWPNVQFKLVPYNLRELRLSLTIGNTRYVLNFRGVPDFQEP